MGTVVSDKRPLVRHYLSCPFGALPQIAEEHLVQSDFSSQFCPSEPLSPVDPEPLVVVLPSPEDRIQTTNPAPVSRLSPPTTQEGRGTVSHLSTSTQRY